MLDKVETRLGTLNVKYGMPDQATIGKVYDNLGFVRGADVFLNTMPGVCLPTANSVTEVHKDRIWLALLTPAEYTGRPNTPCWTVRHGIFVARRQF